MEWLISVDNENEKTFPSLSSFLWLPYTPLPHHWRKSCNQSYSVTLTSIYRDIYLLTLENKVTNLLREAIRVDWKLHNIIRHFDICMLYCCTVQTVDLKQWNKQKHYWSYISLGSCSPQDLQVFHFLLVQIQFHYIFNEERQTFSPKTRTLNHSMFSFIENQVCFDLI